MVIESIWQYFSGLPDPRRRRGRRHRLDELVVIAILAVICCTDNWQEVAQFAWDFGGRHTYSGDARGAPYLACSG